MVLNKQFVNNPIEIQQESQIEPEASKTVNLAMLPIKIEKADAGLFKKVRNVYLLI